MQTAQFVNILYTRKYCHESKDVYISPETLFNHILTQPKDFSSHALGSSSNHSVNICCERDIGENSRISF